jgi:hypothetical protein
MKIFLSPNPTSVSTPSVLYGLHKARSSSFHIMKGYWCECIRCDGGKIVGKTTYYSHNPGGARGLGKRPLRSGRSISPKRSPFPEARSSPVDPDVREPSGDPDPPNITDRLESPSVRVIYLSNRYLRQLISFYYRATRVKTKSFTRRLGPRLVLRLHYNRLLVVLPLLLEVPLPLLRPISTVGKTLPTERIFHLLINPRYSTLSALLMGSSQRHSNPSFVLKSSENYSNLRNLNLRLWMMRASDFPS